MGRRPTIYDIGRVADVSASTVSRALSQHPSVSAKTRARVLKVARDLGFEPGRTTRALAPVQVTVGLVVPAVASAFDAQLTGGIEKAVTEKGGSVQLSQSGSSTEKEKEILWRLADRGIGGIIVLSNATDAHCDGAHVLDVRALGVPLVLIDQEVRNFDGDLVRSDGAGGARQLVEHLISLGHTQIAILTSSASTPSSAQRIQGYRDALTAHRLPIKPEFLWEGDFAETGGYEGMTRFLKMSGSRPTAVFAANAAIAVGAFHAIREAGLRVPEDFALVCFDDVDASNALYPFFTVAAQPVSLMGEIAVQLLYRRRAEGPDAPPVRVVLSTHLVVRRSCGAPSPELVVAENRGSE